MVLLLCQAKRATAGNAPKIVCPNLEGVVRSFTVMVQREGCNQLVDLLLIGWW